MGGLEACSQITFLKDPRAEASGLTKLCLQAGATRFPREGDYSEYSQLGPWLEFYHCCPSADHMVSGLQEQPDWLVWLTDTPTDFTQPPEEEVLSSSPFPSPFMFSPRSSLSIPTFSAAH